MHFSVILILAIRQFQNIWHGFNLTNFTKIARFAKFCTRKISTFKLPKGIQNLGYEKPDKRE